MDHIIGPVFFSAGFFGLEIAAIIVLIMAAIYGRQRVFVIPCGGVAAVLMAGESIIWWIGAAGDYEFGFRSEMALIIVSALSIESLGLYFPSAIMRCKRRQRTEALTPPPIS